MIQIYLPTNTAFDMNGDSVLHPTVCELEANLKGTWTLNLTHPIDDEGRWKDIVKEAVISAPTFMGDAQLFRIDDIDRSDTEINVVAYPIFFDSADEVFLTDVRPTSKNGQETIEILTNGTKYSGESDINSGNTAYFVRRNLMDALNGDDPSFVSIWGGEPLYDNYKVIINERAGGDYGAEIRYGKNLKAVNINENMSTVVTRIVPVAYNGRIYTDTFVDSPLINSYAKVYTREIKFEDVRLAEDLTSEDTEGIIVCNTQEELDIALVQKCEEQFEQGIDKYKLSVDIDLVELENTEEYKDFVDLVKTRLGDTVHCMNTRLGIDVEARAVSITWDCITNSISKTILGDYKSNIIDKWSHAVQKVDEVLNEDGSIMAERIKGILDGIKIQIKIQNTSAQKVDTRAILFEDLDEESPMYGALAIGTQGLQISDTRTADGRDWEWTTAFTAKGGYADAIILGILSDQEGKTYWNLDTGEFVTKKGSIAGWEIEEDALTKTIANPDDSNVIYKISLRPPIESHLESTVILALNKSTDGGAKWRQVFSLISDGRARLGNVSIAKDGTMHVYNEDESSYTRIDYNSIGFFENGTSNVGIYKSSDGNYYMHNIKVLN